MKHKRQTLGKQDDGDDKDSINSDGGKSGKLSSDKFLDDELSKKSCQGCEMPSTGLCNTHEEIPDIGSTRGNNNNTPSATNNNTSFNNNSNGASSAGSTSPFDKLLVEEDSRSNEDSRSHSSPRVSKKTATNSVSVKIEGRRTSPNICERKIGMTKVSPSASSKETPTNEALSIKMSPKSTTVSTMGLMYSHLPQRSSPTTATAIASATVTIQNVAGGTVPQVMRGGMPQFPTQYPMNNQIDYRERAKHPQQHYQMGQGVYNPEIYNVDHSIVNESTTYVRTTHTMPHTSVSRLQGRGRQSYPNYSQHQSQQQQYYYGKNSSGGTTENYNVNHQNYVQSYQNDYSHYGYHPTTVYPSDGTAETIAHDSSSTNYYHHHQSDTILKNQSDYSNKVNYYENNHYTPTNSDPSYIPSEVFPTNTPSSVQTDTNSDNYNSFHQFYSSESSSQNQLPPPTGENSNSSSDFNFLSNLANDYTPEYYQI